MNHLLQRLLCLRSKERNSGEFSDSFDLLSEEEKQITVKELGEKLFLDSGTMTPVLKSLEQKRFGEA